MQLKRNNAPYGNGNGESATVMWPRIAVSVSAFLLVTLGIVMVYSASSVVNIDAGTSVYADAVKQLALAVAGTLFCLFLARVVPYQWWRGPLTIGVFAVSLVLLVLTAVMGTESLGAQRWLVLGPVNLQPSEFAKIGVLLAAAKLVADYQEGAMEPRVFLGCFVALNIVLVTLVFVAQSDLGTTLICFVGIVAILWLAEVRARFIGIYAAVVGGFGVIGLLSASYRMERLLSFMHPWDDYYGSGYQLIHSMYAFAQGGIFGVGLGNSAEKYLYLPEGSTDFIFSVVGEELGLVGALFIIALFLVLLVGGLRMAQAAPDRFGGVLCGSFAIILVFQAFLNIGCVIGFMPITGKPLPFVSAGGSSLLASLVMLGIMLSVSYASGEAAVRARRQASIRPLPQAGDRARRSGSGHGYAARSSAPATGRARVAQLGAQSGYGGSRAAYGTARAGAAYGLRQAQRGGYASRQSSRSSRSSRGRR